MLSRSGPSGQYVTEDVLVERLAGTETEPVPTGVHGRQRRRRLRHHRRMPAEGRRGDARSDVTAGALAEGGQHVPDEGALTLLRHPRLEVVGGHHPGEALALGVGRQLHGLGRMELFQHGGVADLQGAHPCTLGGGPVDSARLVTARSPRQPRGRSGVSDSLLVALDRVAGVTQRVLDVLAGLLGVGAGLIGVALGLQALVVGGVADPALALPASSSALFEILSPIPMEPPCADGAQE